MEMWKCSLLLRKMQSNFKFNTFLLSSTLEQIFRTQSWIEPSRTVSHLFFIQVQSYHSSFSKWTPALTMNIEETKYRSEAVKSETYRALLSPFWRKERRTIFFQQCKSSGCFEYQNLQEILTSAVHQFVLPYCPWAFNKSEVQKSNCKACGCSWKIRWRKEIDQDAAKEQGPEEWNKHCFTKNWIQS